MATKLTRRDFVKKASALSLVPLAGLTSNLPTNQPLLEPEPPAWPDPERTAVLDEMANRLLHQAVVPLETLWGLVRDARSQDPYTVDGQKFYRLQWEVIAAFERTIEMFDSKAFEQMVEAATSKPSHYWLILDMLESEEEPWLLRNEIDHLSCKHPELAEELRRRLDNQGAL